MSKVSIVRVVEKPYDEEVSIAVRAAVEMIGGPAAFARAGQKVLIKPNWWSYPGEHPREPAHRQYSTTDRRIVEAAAHLFVELGCQVLIGEDPACGLTVKKVYDGFRAEEVARRAGAELVNLRAAGYRAVPAPRGREFKELRISAIALEADLIVSLPLLKSHMLTGVTLTLKNMKGVIPPVEKKAFHQRNLSQGIADLATVISPRLTIVDAIIASDNWVSGGGLRPMGLILAGDDPVATDAVCCHLMAADPRRIDHMRWAHEMGVGEIALENIEVIGPAVRDLAVPFKLPADPLKMVGELDNIELLVGEACSGCLNRLGEVFMALGKEKLAQSGEITFIVGKGVEPRPGRANILMGLCTAPHKEKGIYLPDCAPMAEDVKQAIQYVAGEVSELLYSWDAGEIPTD
jgi:uncharacterized protein (DUF362 family)